MVEVNYRAARDGRWIIDVLGLLNVHPDTQCAGEWCVLHNPSKHHMLYWPPVFDHGTGLIYRSCIHGTHHPDPDSLQWYRSRARPTAFDSHYCDGCCGGLPSGV